MPGIVGIITNRPRAGAECELKKMVEALRHESFYKSGTWIDAEQGIYVGWVARAESFADRMPVQNERGDVTLVFSGEEFPEPGLIPSLRSVGMTSIVMTHRTWHVVMKRNATFRKD